MSGKVIPIVLVILVIVAAAVLIRYAEAQEPRYLLGNLEFNPLPCIEGSVPRYNFAEKRFVCTLPITVGSTDPGCTITNHIGRGWIDTTGKGAYKICMPDGAGAAWSIVKEN